MKKLLEGYIEFESPLPVSMECLGKKYSINISGIPGFLVTPEMNDKFATEKELGRLQSPKLGNIKFRDDLDWGRVVSWPQGDSIIKTCRIIFPEIEEELFEETGYKVVKNLSEWRLLLIDNISVSLHDDYRTKRVKYYKSFGLGEFALYKKISGPDKTFIPLEYKQEAIIINVTDTLGLDSNLLQQILDETSKKNTPLLPFYFFLVIV
jgi:hypothetical protein